MTSSIAPTLAAHRPSESNSDRADKPNADLTGESNANAEGNADGASDGRFVRSESAFRNWITSDGEPGPTGIGGFAAEPGRYHLYVSLACPWAHRALIMRALKGLTSAIDVSVVHWHLERPQGWSFEPGPGVVPDPLFQAQFLSEIYRRADPDYDGRFTVPVLWDKQRETIVSNESADVILMLNSAFQGVGATSTDYYPQAHRDASDAINARVYDTLNNGVYKAGFAKTQSAYEEVVGPLFDTLDWLDAQLATQRYLVGSSITTADIRLFTTLIRFDAVYYSHFKCNVRRIADYPHLAAYLRDLYQTDGFHNSVNFEHIKRHYYGSMLDINPTGIVPVGPALDLDSPHHRDGLN